MNEQNNNMNEQFNSNTGIVNSGIVAQPMYLAKKNDKKMIFIIIGAVIAVLVAILLCTLLFSGKTLTCTMSEDDMGMAMHVNFKIKFKKDEVSKTEVNLTVDLGEYVDYKQDLLEQFQEQYTSDEIDGADVKITSDDSKIYIKINADKKGFEESGLGTLGTYKEVKEDLEAEGFTCK